MPKRIVVAGVGVITLLLVVWAGAAMRQWFVWKGLDAAGREQVRIERSVLADVEAANPELVIDEQGFSDNNAYLYAEVDGTAELRPPPGLAWDDEIGWWSGTHHDGERSTWCAMSWRPDDDPELTISCDRP